MGQVLHGCATTIEAIRRAVQHSQESLRSLSKRYGVNPKTVAKWRKRGSVADLKTGPKEAKSSIKDEAIVVAFRKHTLLPCDEPLVNRNFALILITIVAVILHGSLYPYAFHLPPGGAGPVAALLATWAMPPRGLGDLIANVLLYVPFGLFATLAMGSRARIWLVTLAGFALCTAVEILQYYDAGRVTNASDAYLNTFGTWAGAIAAGFFASRPQWRQLPSGRLSPIPWLLLAAMLGWRLYPYVPVIDLHKYWRGVTPLLRHPQFGGYAGFFHFALWLTAIYLLVRVSPSRKTRLLAPLFAAFVFTAKIFIINQSLQASDVLGAALALMVWLSGLQERRWAALAIAGVLGAAVIAERLEPFRFVAASGPFHWLPFTGFLQGSLGVNIQSFFEKVFVYGSFVWIVSEAGLRLSLATVAVAVLLLVTSLAEVHLPGRSAEITDALMVLILGPIFAAMQPAAQARQAPARATPIEQPAA